MKTMLTSSKLAQRLIVLLLLASPFGAFSQIGVGTTNPHPSSMMHISPGAGNNKGFILPKITSGSRVVLDSTQNIAHGLIFFDTDLQKFYYFHQSPRQWFELDHDWIRKDIAGASPVVSNHIYSGVPGNVGIGTGTAFDPTEKLTVVGNVSIGAAAWAQDSNIALPQGALAVDDWLGVNTVTRTGGNELDVKGQVGISSNLTVGGNVVVTGDVTANKFNGLGIVPVGTVLMWSGAINTATNFDVNGTGVVGTQFEGWQMCNGFGSAPDLRGRFIVGCIDHSTQNTQPSNSGGYTNTEFDESDYATIGSRGGKDSVTLAISHMPTHDHGGATRADGNHSHTVSDATRSVNDYDVIEDAEGAGNDIPYNSSTITRTTSTDGSHTHVIDPEGDSMPHENRPPYYVLAYIIRKF